MVFFEVLVFFAVFVVVHIKERWPTLLTAVFLRYVVAQPPHIKHVIYRHIQDLVARDEHLRENLKAEAHTLPDIVLTEVCRSS